MSAKPNAERTSGAANWTHLVTPCHEVARPSVTFARVASDTDKILPDQANHVVQRLNVVIHRRIVALSASQYTTRPSTKLQRTFFICGPNCDKPTNPPFAPIALISSSLLFLGCSFNPHGKMCEKHGGLPSGANAITSALVLGPTWLKSQAIPTRAISVTTSRPKPVKAESLSSV